ncbi:ankyrin repeat domain-containing protein [Achromobacter dolens]|uniref:ankyrin repeat domain-containing protein n=1 Tax=Achromobacter dolens TaxID=1287738 RepID=UPI001F075F23|nr:ankyrin repeat domain-containing protein [Achromobacter dolens]
MRQAAMLTALLAAVTLAATTPARAGFQNDPPPPAAPLSVAPPPPAAPSPRAEPKPPSDCDCASPYREYRAAETAETRALFNAVAAGDEAAFAAALAKVKQPGDYALEGVPLLHALLMPAGKRGKHVYWDMPTDEAARLRQACHAALPARTRMLAALLATRPALDDITYESRRPSLQLALLYGTPEIVDMLLAAGARPDQRGDENKTPLEFLLSRDFEFAVRMTYLPRLVDRQQTTRMVLALLKAGAARPFAYIDEHADDAMRQAFTDAQGQPRRAADYLAWGPLVELTEGAEVVRALAATGTRPAYGEGASPLALAAYTGNAGAVTALAELGPRTAPDTGYGASGDRDLWLDAAQAAVAAGHGDIAVPLLRADMPFNQRGPQTGTDAAVFVRMEAEERPIMNLAAGKGDVVTLQRLLALGATVEGDDTEPHGDTPLADAVRARQAAAVRVLLAAGANPTTTREGYDRKSALQRAIEADDAPLLHDLLAATPPAALQALLADPARSPLAQALRQPGKQGAAMLRHLVDAGLDLKTLDASAIRQALENRDGEMARYLIDAGVPVNPQAAAAASDDPYDNKGVPPLLVAVTSGQAAMVDALLAKGADPLGLAPDGRSALYWAIGGGDAAMLERLLAAGARLDDPRLPRAPATHALLNAALASGDLALVKRVEQGAKQPLADACLPSGGEYALLDRPGYFAQLQAAGYTGARAECVGKDGALPQRLLSALLRDRQLAIARRDTVIDVLTRLKAVGADLDARQTESGDTPLVAAILLGRADLADALLAAGASPDAADAQGRSSAWAALASGQPDMLALLARHHARFDGAAAPSGQSFSQTLACQAAPAFAAALQAAGAPLKQACPAKPGAAKALGKAAARVAGHYYLRGMREVGSELLLSPDGRFDYLMSYGAVDIQASGTWRLEGRQVRLDTPPIQPFSAIAKVGADSRPAEGDELTVRVYYEGRPVKVDVAMSSASADYAGTPKQSEGADGVSAPIAPGELKALAVFVPLPSGARWHSVDVSKSDIASRALRIDLELPESASRTPLHMTLALREDGALVAAQGGRELRYEKE